MVSRVAGSCSWIAAAVLLATGSVASAQPAGQIDRDGIRRVLLDRCVYGQHARPTIDKMKMVDACQCASQRVVREANAEDLTAAARSVPDSWTRAVETALAQCVR